MKFLLISPVYRYLRALRRLSPSAQRVVSAVTGVESPLFLYSALIDRSQKRFIPAAREKFLRPFRQHTLPLTDGTHGVRLHGFFDFARSAKNVIYYSDDEQFSVALLTEQIMLTRELAKISGVDDTVYPSLFTIHLGDRLRRERREALTLVSRVLRQVLPLAAEQRVIISLENMWNFRSDCYELGSDLENFAEIFESLGDQPHLGMTFDFAHALIHYRGKTAVVSALLEKHHLLKKIYHFHFTAPAANYLRLAERMLPSEHLTFIRLITTLLFRNPDNQGGLRAFFNSRPEVKETYLAWVRQIVADSAAATPPYNCGTLELGVHFPLTRLGASVGDVEYSLNTVQDICH
ncbi:TIM barrel protein [Candidatus Falkowbacteria bacterium]|nr:TIM barrel protein [Candidatus Falkowbacteria bacterium]